MSTSVPQNPPQDIKKQLQEKFDEIWDIINNPFIAALIFIVGLIVLLVGFIFFLRLIIVLGADISIFGIAIFLHIRNNYGKSSRQKMWFWLKREMILLIIVILLFIIRGFWVTPS